MSKLAAKDSYKRKPFKLQIYKSRGQNRSCGQEVTKTGQIVEIGDISQEIVQDRIIEVTILEEMLKTIVDRTIVETTEIIEIRTDQDKDHLQEITVTAVIEVQAIVD